MRRREFIAALGSGVLAWPLVAHAQDQPTAGVRRIGVMTALAADNPFIQHWRKEVSQQLESRGWKEGSNLRIDYYGGYGGNLDQARVFAKELVSWRPT
jgi:hypothetical protein